MTAHVTLGLADISIKANLFFSPPDLYRLVGSTLSPPRGQDKRDRGMANFSFLAFPLSGNARESTVDTSHRDSVPEAQETLHFCAGLDKP